MIGQLRIYAINEGQMDEWLQVFNEQIAPIHEKYGIHIAGAWLTQGKNEFVWIREFENEQDRDEKLKVYNGSPERRALGDKPGSYHHSMEVRDIEHVYRPQPLRV